jgi:hypothetical protein
MTDKMKERPILFAPANKPEHCYMCEHRPDICQGDFYCNFDGQTHCLLDADFPADCPLEVK